jgi:hypothetical protein
MAAESVTIQTPPLPREAARRSAVVIEEKVSIPGWVDDLASFRRWARSGEMPERGQFAYLNGEVWVDLTGLLRFTQYLLHRGNLVSRGIYPLRPQRSSSPQALRRPSPPAGLKDQKKEGVSEAFSVLRSELLGTTARTESFKEPRREQFLPSSKSLGTGGREKFPPHRGRFSQNAKV